MNYRLTEADMSAPVRVGQSAWQRVQLSEDLGACHTDYLRFDDGLTVAYTDYHPRHDLLEVRADAHAPSLVAAIALEGESSNLGADGQRVDFIAGHSTVAAYDGRRGDRRFPAHRPIRQLRLIADASLLHRYGMADLLGDPGHGPVIGHQPAPRPLFQGKHSTAIRRLAETLVHLHHQNGSLLDTHIAALGLLSQQVSPCIAQAPFQGKGNSKMRADEQDRILRARDIMLSHFDRPLTLAYLCAAVGTNEFKLKQGFRDLFGTSPYRLLTHIRMRKAWELLETGLPASTVGYQVGFQHPSSFSAAFERHYGRTPKSVAGRNRGEADRG